MTTLTMSRVLDFNAFLATYVNTNVAPGAVPYDRNFFKELQGRLAKVDDPSFPKLDFPVLVSLKNPIFSPPCSSSGLSADPQIVYRQQCAVP